MVETFRVLAVLALFLVVLAFFGPAVAIISILGRVRIGKFDVDFRGKSWLARLLVAVIALLAWWRVGVWVTNLASPWLRGAALSPSTQITVVRSSTNNPNSSLGATSTQMPQRVFLRRSCGELTHVVEADRPIQLLYGVWVAKEQELLEYNLKHLSVELWVDGKEVRGILQPAAPISRIPCGKVFEEGYWAAYMVQLPPLSPGEHIIEFVYSFDEQVTDGYDSDGDGELDLFGPGEWGEQSYTLVVEPLNTRPR